jgi:hypothetical protein
MDDYDLEIYQGSTYSLTIGLTDGDDVPIDLTNYDISGYLKFRYSDSNRLISLNPIRLAPLASGNISLNIPDSGTSVLPVTIGVYDIELYHTGNNTVDKILKGRAYVYPEVTY